MSGANGANGLRLVAVLGYSRRRIAGLHPVCAARLERAVAEAGPADAVLMSGLGEADEMARSWTGRSAVVLLDHDARTTLGNAVGVARAARALGASDVVLVTSSWHARRAAVLVRAALRGTGATVAVSPAEGRGAGAARVRELACWLAVPAQARLAARARRLD